MYVVFHIVVFSPFHGMRYSIPGTSYDVVGYKHASPHEMVI